MEQVLNQKVKVQDRGMVRQITVLEAIAKGLAHDAVKGNHKAMTLLLGYEPEIAREATRKIEPFDDGITGDDPEGVARAARTSLRIIRGD